MLMAINDLVPGPRRARSPFEALVRYRTVGDATCTAAVESAARPSTT
jgi:sulfate adenylyltransferase subunit 2